MLKLSDFLAVSRANFLTLTLACLLLALAIGYYYSGWPPTSTLVLVTVVAIFAHVSVNALNEYIDFRSGLDFKTRKTAFSGGSGTLVRNPKMARWALILALVSLLIVTIAGLTIVNQYSFSLLWLGVPGVLLILLYTKPLNQEPVLCLIAPGVGFGLLMTLGAAWVFARELNLMIWVLAVVVMLLVNNLLLLNQFPDCEADESVGRFHFPIMIGRRRSAWLFSGQLVLAYVILIVAVWNQVIPDLSIFALLSAVLAPKLIKGVHRYANDIPQLVPFLGINVALIHAFILLLALGIALD
ncbi:MAG: prenyltransferase [Aliidiomarina sp.]|uniref:prenyltransferase n=1 Tax=Aliidiomarina sp. TaxID=1872439 RepID=UPI0025BD8817|nr:prenyltransferase [Aliidiomarina sp.]MCH8501955.1 prenyltransferase [Aliidiomarina sp.]